MAENAGTIYYDVDINTQGVIDAQQKLRTANKGIESSFSGVDGSSKKAQSGLDGFGRKAGAAGIQIQQFVGQVQGGQNAMVALSQQAADLGIVLGAPLIGAVVGIASAFAGPFITALFNADDALDSVRERIDEVRASADAVKIRDLQAAIEQQSKTAEQASNSLDKLAESGVTVGRSFEEAAFNAERESQALSALQEELEKITRAESFLNAEKNKRLQADRDLQASQNAQMRDVDEYLSNLERELTIRENFARQTIAQTQRQFQDEQALANEQLQVRLAAIGEARQQQIDIGQSYDQAEYEARALHTEKLAALDEQRTNAEKAEAARRLQAKQAELTAYAQLGGQLSNLMATIGAEQSALGKAIFLANQALAVASIVVDTEARAAPFLGTPLYGQIKALGYASAGIAAGVAVGQAFAGRQTGGPVQAGSAYRVNEAGAEGYKFSSAGREYIQMLGGSGEIVPADKMGGSGVQVSVTVNNGSGVGANVSSSDDGKYITIDTFRTDMAENGPMSRSMTGAFSGLKRRTE